ncbi:hypothetical protein CSAL01_10460 [Colletotrichum salicis]|uniref:Uncharacterized protein n=1 Tax=Colletotrichum salicis TaxID=1209931 RepID=A0A135UHZ9_9PEZI|nr:hypothetical protein CSAL01_10460 [Colletotrichum salicis]
MQSVASQHDAECAEESTEGESMAPDGPRDSSAHALQSTHRCQAPAMMPVFFQPTGASSSFKVARTEAESWTNEGMETTPLQTINDVALGITYFSFGQLPTRDESPRSQVRPYSAINSLAPHTSAYFVTPGAGEAPELGIIWVALHTGDATQMWLNHPNRYKIDKADMTDAAEHFLRQPKLHPTFRSLRSRDHSLSNHEIIGLIYHSPSPPDPALPRARYGKEESRRGFTQASFDSDLSFSATIHPSSSASGVMSVSSLLTDGPQDAASAEPRPSQSSFRPLPVNTHWPLSLCAADPSPLRTLTGQQHSPEPLRSPDRPGSAMLIVINRLARWRGGPYRGDNSSRDDARLNAPTAVPVSIMMPCGTDRLPHCQTIIIANDIGLACLLATVLTLSG